MEDMANRLKDATSPYLLQHADNPVDWWPWSDEAFEEARRRDVPVLLSVGYAACHWCHVMAHESFEDPDTAKLMNQRLVAIKVDREERPDVDDVYMTATQAMTGQGGWPMTVFMTPDREPFYCGTYFPRANFQRLIEAITTAWADDRDQVQEQATHVAGALASNAAATARTLREGAGPLAALADLDDGAARQALAELTATAVAGLAEDFDPVNAGFGQAPKFPPSMVLEFLLRHYEQTGDEQAHQLAGQTLEAMARGGMYDQLGGGFARYSVDEAWVVPHFEKMLYDNALLARVYAHLWRRTGSDLARRVAEQTCDWMIRELQTPQGGLAASLDADSEGEEGRFYVWSPAELVAALGPEDGAYAAEVFGVTRAGTFEHGSSVLQRRADPLDAKRFETVRAALFEARAQRPRPGRDDKVVAAWNGLAIAALAETGLLLDRADLIEAATASAGLLARVHLSDGHLARSSRDGVAGTGAGVLDDYACVADGFLALSGVTGDPRWVALAGELLEVVLESFGDGSGGFFDTAAGAERLIYRPADPADNATPSGTFAAAGSLLSYGALTGSARHRDAALVALAVLPTLAGRYPRAAGSGLAVAEAVLAGPAEIAVVGPPGAEPTRDLLRTALAAATPGAVLATGDGADPDHAPVPLLVGRGLVDGAAAAYVCRNFACQLPVTDPAALRAVLAPTDHPTDHTV
jgi:uncharacterized protein YyaL (SSP411 family)